jgi:hypothetical protein
MKFSSFAGALLLAATAVPSHAQEKRPIGPFVGGGLEFLTLRDGSRWTPGTTWQAGLQVQPPGSRVGLRAVGTFFNETAARRAQALTFGIDATYDLASDATRPYVAVGGGMAWLYLSPSPTPLGSFAVNAPLETWSAFASVGGGVQRRVAGLWLYMDARLHVFANGRGWAPYILPVAVGVRF